MDGAGHQFLAGAALAGNQHRRFAGRHLPDQRKHLLHARRSAHQVVQYPLVAQLPLQPLGLFGHPALRRGPLQQNPHGVGLDGLLQKPERPYVVNRGNGRFNAPERGQHDGGWSTSLGRQPPQQFESVHPRHHQVGNQHMRLELSQLVQRFLPIGGSFGHESPG